MAHTILHRKRQLFTFCVAWCAYASSFLLRKPLGIIKSDLQSTFGFDETSLGWFDAALLIPYATLQLIQGSIVDRYGPRITFTLCLVISSLAMIGFSAVSNFYIFFMLFFINGSAMSLTWPCTVKAIGSWFNGSTRNSVMGVFGSSGMVGGIIGVASAVYFQREYGWNSVYFVPSLIVLLVAVFVFFFLYSPDQLDNNGIENDKEKENKGELKVLSWIELWRIPGVLNIALAMFFLKLVRYCIFLWLPMYLHEKNGYTKSEAGLFSTLFEMGGLVGNVSIGIIIDRFFKGNTLLGTTLFAFLSSFAISFYFLTISTGSLLNIALLVIGGAFVCGPETMLASSVSLELAEINGLNAGSAILGFVNGIGSTGVAIEGPVIGFIVHQCGWNAMSTTLVAFGFLGSLCCWKALSAYQKQLLLTVQ